MSLRQYQQQSEQVAHQADEKLVGKGIRPGTQWFEPYHPPMQGEVNGEPVLVLQIGDQPGSSDVFKCIDAEGNTATVRERDLRITGVSVQSVGGYLPLDAALAIASQQTRGRQTQNR